MQIFSQSFLSEFASMEFCFRFTVILRVLNSCTRSLSASSCDKHRRGGCANLFPQINDSGKEHHGNAKN